MASAIARLVVVDNDGREVIEQQLEVLGKGLSSSERSQPDALDLFYEINRTVDTIKQRQFSRIALQFPDELLGDSVAVAQALRSRTNQEVYILADTTFGSFDVDEIAAQHVNADLIVHYGRASLSKTTRLPVLFVFGRQPVDVDHCWDSFKTLFGDDLNAYILVLYDVMCAHSIESWANRWKASASFQNIAISDVAKDWHITSVENEDARGRTFNLAEGVDIDAYKVFYIGSESPTLTNLMMTLNKCSFFTYDPEQQQARQETLNVSRALMRRYYLVQRAKDADVIGIVVATLAVSGYMAIVDHLKRLIRASGKRAFTFVMGKLNVAKMANFAEVDVYVVVAAAENSLVDSKEFSKPIVTPFELEIALARDRNWTGTYLTDFGEILPGLVESTLAQETRALERANRATDEDEDEPYFSLVTGSYKATSNNSTPLTSTDNSTTLTVRNSQAVVLTESGRDLMGGRTFRGLEQRIGETPVTLAIEGLVGIARGYENEGAKRQDS